MHRLRGRTLVAGHGQVRELDRTGSAAGAGAGAARAAGAAAVHGRDNGVDRNRLQVDGQHHVISLVGQLGIQIGQVAGQVVELAVQAAVRGHDGVAGRRGIGSARTDVEHRAREIGHAHGVHAVALAVVRGVDAVGRVRIESQVAVHRQGANRRLGGAGRQGRARQQRGRTHVARTGQRAADRHQALHFLLGEGQRLASGDIHLLDGDLRRRGEVGVDVQRAAAARDGARDVAAIEVQGGPAELHVAGDRAGVGDVDRAHCRPDVQRHIVDFSLDGAGVQDAPNHDGVVHHEAGLEHTCIDDASADKAATGDFQAHASAVASRDTGIVQNVAEHNAGAHNADGIRSGQLAADQVPDRAGHMRIVYLDAGTRAGRIPQHAIVDDVAGAMSIVDEADGRVAAGIGDVAHHRYASAQSTVLNEVATHRECGRSGQGRETQAKQDSKTSKRKAARHFVVTM
ncbi:hypothetical protein D3C71_1239270 [compost metagenome]